MKRGSEMTAEKATAQEATRKVAFAKVLAIQIIAYVVLVALALVPGSSVSVLLGVGGTQSVEAHPVGRPAG